MKKILNLISLLLFTCALVKSQNSPTIDKAVENKFSFEIGSDLVSRYIWRGIPLSLSANIQPSFSVSHSGLSFGAWGSYSLFSGYSETDLFLSYDIGSFTFGLYDYYNEDESDLSVNDYWNLRNTDTVTSPHTLEGSLTFNGTDNFPLSVTLATFFYGADRDENNKNYYSTYLEASYTLSLDESEIRFFLGGTTGNGYYSDKAAIVNAGINASHNLKITDSFSIPVYTTFIINPDAGDVFLVFGITF